MQEILNELARYWGQGASVTLVTRHPSPAPAMERPYMVEPFLERVADQPFVSRQNAVAAG
jgi:hypothetical protein